jgi:hypothetical protein
MAPGFSFTIGARHHLVASRCGLVLAASATKRHWVARRRAEACHLLVAGADESWDSGNTGGSGGRTRARAGVKAIQAWTSRLGKEASHGNMRYVKFLGEGRGFCSSDGKIDCFFNIRFRISLELLIDHVSRDFFQINHTNSGPVTRRHLGPTTISYGHNFNTNE